MPVSTVSAIRAPDGLAAATAVPVVSGVLDSMSLWGYSFIGCSAASTEPVGDWEDRADSGSGSTWVVQEGLTPVIQVPPGVYFVSFDFRFVGSVDVGEFAEVRPHVVSASSHPIGASSPRREGDDPEYWVSGSGPLYVSTGDIWTDVVVTSSPGIGDQSLRERALTIIALTQSAPYNISEGC